MKKLNSLLFFAFYLVIGQSQDIDLDLFTGNLSQPTTITNAGDDRLFITEKRGYIRIVRSDGTLEPNPFLDIDSKVINTGNERGLLGLAFHPDYKNNGTFFINYNDNSGGTVVAKYTVTNDPDVADANSEAVLLTYSQPFTNHNGGCLKFGPDGYLYIGTGDGGSGGDPGNRSQNKQSRLGKLLRIDVDSGSPFGIPPDNPFVGDATTLDEIWALGLRNPWKFSFDRITNDLWIGDVGQDLWEEIDFQTASSTGGENYGWRCYEATHTFNTNGCGPAGSYIDPVFEYQNTNSVGCSVTGGYVYRGGQYAALYGKYIFADYCSGKFWAISPNGQGGWDAAELEDFSAFQYGAFGEDQHGELYVAGHGNGFLYKISEATCLPTAIILAPDSLIIESGDSLVAISGDGLTYQWKLNGNEISGANDPIYFPGEDGHYSVEVTNSSNCSNSSNSVKVLLSTTAIRETGNQISVIDVYPVPSHSDLLLNIVSSENILGSLIITNTMGQNVYLQKLSIPTGTKAHFITHDLSPGMYWLTLQSGDSVISKRFIVQ